MKTINHPLFGAAVAMTLLVSPQLFAEGGDNGPGNGGDACELRIQNIREDLKKWIADGGATHLKLPATLEVDTYNKTMTDAIADAEVSCTSDKLTLKGAEKTCLNSVGGAVKIICNREAFNKTSESEQYVLIHHEYAGVAGIEVNAGLASDYSISRQLTSFLKDTVVKKLGIPNQKPLPGPVEGMEFAPIKAGKFMMGSPATEPGRKWDETQHQVEFKRGFEMMTTEVTQKQWFLVMGTNPSYFRDKKYCPKTHTIIDGVEMCPAHPVEQVSWDDAQDFIGQLSLITTDRYTYRLPTEAEWEYAARAGTTTPYSFDPDAESLDEYAWHSKKQTFPVALKKANPWGLFDVYGNVWEWTADWYQEDLGRTPVVNPVGPVSGSHRVIRGGDWNDDARSLRSAYRYYFGPGYRSYDVGFRLVRQ